MRVYIGITGHIKIIKISKFYFGPGSPKTIFWIFRFFFLTKKTSGNLGISSETTRESRVKRPGNPKEWPLEGLGGYLDLLRDLELWIQIQRRVPGKS